MPPAAWTGSSNRWFLDPIYRGSYPADIVEDIARWMPTPVAQFEAAVHDGDLDTISQPIDTQGVNYYHGDFLSGTAPAQAPVSGGPATERAGRSPLPVERRHPFGRARAAAHGAELGGAARGPHPGAAAGLE